jgi:hypothetical protein
MFRFFTGSILGILSGIFLGVVLIAVIFGATTAALMTTGGPTGCEPGGGPVTVNQANSDAFKQKWEAFDQTIENGGTATVSFSESEIASRAESWANEQDTPFEDIRACIHDGSGEATARLKVLGFDVKLRIKGTLDLSGDKPKAKIDDISIGNVPGFMIRPAEEIIDRALDEALNDLEIENGYTLTLKNGEAVVDGKPVVPAP